MFYPLKIHDIKSENKCLCFFVFFPWKHLESVSPIVIWVLCCIKERDLRQSVVVICKVWSLSHRNFQHFYIKRVGSCPVTAAINMSGNWVIRVWCASSFAQLFRCDIWTNSPHSLKGSFVFFVLNECTVLCFI